MQVGGIQLPNNSAYSPPRYPRRYAKKADVLAHLEEWTETARRAGLGSGAPVSVDVLIPSYRPDSPVIAKMMTVCAGHG